MNKKPKKKPKFWVLANCPIRTVHQGQTREECDRWAKENREYYRSIGSSLCVIENKPLVKKKPVRAKRGKASPKSTVPENYVTGGPWAETGRKERR